MTTPLDHPTPARPHRVYAALTNHCNRACPWCSTCSSPAGGTFLSLDDFERALPEQGPFEVQLEGGEPTVHPRFWDFVVRARAIERCTRLVLCTNGVRRAASPPSRLRALAGAPRRAADGEALASTTHLLDARRGAGRAGPRQTRGALLALSGATASSC
jgi:uncharacterized radical SAM superfamily Fe-S cluster-containing enzyme